MASASTQIDLNVSADEVWSLIGGFGNLRDWLPYIPRSELTEGGRVRHLQNPDGAAIVERLVEYHHESRYYTYALLQSPFPVTRYRSTLKADPLPGGGCRVRWTGKFTPHGVTEEAASTLFQNIYEEGLKALAARLAEEAALQSKPAPATT